ncbi:hypothetical protein HK099_004562, partial [Clydaea vesicula]
IKTLITEIVIKLNLQLFSIPIGLQEEERQQLIWEREVIKKNLKETAKVVRSAQSITRKPSNRGSRSCGALLGYAPRKNQCERHTLRYNHSTIFS